jgi:hypothetical protein
MSRRATARRASAKKRYTLDPFEGIEELQDADSEHSPVRRSRDSDSEDEFVVEADPADAAEDDDDDDDDGDVSGADVEAEAQSDPASDAGEQDLDDAISIAVDDEEDEEEGDEDDEDRPAGTGRTVPRKPREPLTGPDGLLFNRGLPDSVTRKSGKHDKRLFLFGSSIEEFSAIEKACMKWDGQDTLPIRRKPQETGSNAFDYSYWQGNSARKREEKESWNWATERAKPERRQMTRHKGLSSQALWTLLSLSGLTSAVPCH